MTAPKTSKKDDWLTGAAKLIKELDKQDDAKPLTSVQEKKLSVLNQAANSKHGINKGHIRTDKAIESLQELMTQVRSGAKKVK